MLTASVARFSVGSGGLFPGSSLQAPIDSAKDIKSNFFNVLVLQYVDKQSSNKGCSICVLIRSAVFNGSMVQ
jgi:hypothetical protein